jgi:hypothetical protein
MALSLLASTGNCAHGLSRTGDVRDFSIIELHRGYLAFTALRIHTFLSSIMGQSMAGQCPDGSPVSGSGKLQWR